MNIVQRWKKRGAAYPLVGRLFLILRQTAKSGTVPDDYRHFSVRNPDDPWTGSVWGRGTDEIFASICLEGADV